jgi:hypothetical protein
MAAEDARDALFLERVADLDGWCVDMTWDAKARARHRLESGSSESRDSDVSEARPVD